MREGAGFRWFRRVALTVVALFTAAPLWVIVSSSIVPPADVRGPFHWIPRSVTLAPYLDTWATTGLGRSLVNSVVVAAAATAASVVVAVFAAYAIARFDFAGRRAFGLLVLSTQVMPAMVVFLPLFVVYAAFDRWWGIGLIGSHGGLILTYLAFSLPVCIWVLTGVFADVRRDLEDAAAMDGLGRVGTLLRVVLPIARPALAAVAVLSFALAWGEVMMASVLTTQDTRTVAVGLQSYLSAPSVQWNQLMAACVISSIPAVAGFVAIRRYLMRGWTHPL
ncbi:multiple sugar transport system permease protein [Jiangella mangrovi]|uniref:Multiple sugar transport system permease protein n=1 Tax=Jiangella mangrovi TaxID=1524084 RepID=A0A7W9LNH5_9ACTN|nr:multiple sugar transport system permease protein [Jiangella mangrovi]